MNLYLRLPALILAVLAAAHLSGCGGGGGGGGSSNPGGSGGSGGSGGNGGNGPGNPSDPPPLATAYGFSHSTGDIVAVTLPTDDTAPALALLRDSGTGAPDTLVALLPSGKSALAQVDEKGWPIRLALGDELFVFSNYVEGASIEVSYTGPGSVESEQILDISQCSAPPAFDAGESPDAALNAFLEWFADGSYACLATALADLSTEDVGAALDAVSAHAAALLEDDIDLARVVKNKLLCGSETQSDCAAILIQHAPELMAGLANIDPNAQTVAGFTVENDTLRMIRSEWDPLIVSEAVDMDLSWRELSCELSIFAEVDESCSAQYVPPEGVPFNPHGPTFVLDGVTYSSSPVADETITGFAYPLTGMGISDGEVAGARVWYGANSCISFRTAGTGVQDMKGGTSTTIDSFPWKKLEFAPGTKTVGTAKMRGFNYPIQYVVDPDYDRRSELREFQWGVRLNDDGSVYVTSDGYYDFALKFTDGSTMHGLWDPSINAPADKFLISIGWDQVNNGLRNFSNALPTTGHFCMFREVTSVTLEPRCVETPASPGDRTRKLCYMNGMLNGDYRLTGPNGEPIEGGEFENNRPSGGWTVWQDDGSVWHSGSFSEEGAQSGAWEVQSGDTKITAPFSSALTATDRDTFTRYLDGSYLEHVNGILRLEGQLVKGYEDGWWNTYNSSGHLARADEYDAGTLITDGEICYSGGDCVETKHAWRKQSQIYTWNSCFGSYRTDVQWNFDGSFASETCYTLNGTPAEPSLGAVRVCPKVSCQ